MSGSHMNGRERSGSGRLWLVGLLLVAVVVGVVLSTRAEPALPFSVESTEPTGYAAVGLLLEDRGVQVAHAEPAALDDGLDVGAGAAMVVPVPSSLDDAQRARVQELAQAGATVVLGEPVSTPGDVSSLDELSFLGGRVLVDTPAMPVATGVCDIAALEDLGPIDAAFSVGIPAVEPSARCYDEGLGALILQQAAGSGSVITLASPLLWSNARLQPAKEEGGEPLANGATALRLLGDAERVTFLDPVPGVGVAPDGTQSPIALLPLPVKLALAQLVAAFVLFIWWRSRRLGRPVRERLPVEIAGSELVVAVGDLLRRRGDAARAAESIREDTRRVLLHRLGLAPDTDPATLVQVVATRTGRPPDEVGSALYGATGAPVADAAALAQLVQTLDSIRQEVLHVPSPV